MVQTEIYIEGAGQGILSPFFDQSGFLHFVSERTGEICQVDKNKMISVVCNSGGQPSGACFGPDNNVYVADQAHGAVVVFLEGKLQVVVQGYEEHMFKGPHSIIFDSKGTIYFTDSGPFGETGIHSPKGSLFSIVSGQRNSQKILKPLALGALAHPTGIALSPNEQHIYVTEMMTNRLLRFTQRPANIFHASVFHQFSGGLGPSGVAVSKNGTIFVSHFDFAEDGSQNQGKVSVLSPEGVKISEITFPGPQLTGLAISHDNAYLYVTESSTNNLFRVTL